MNLESAEIVALRALSFVVGDEKSLRTFLTQTGLTADEMRTEAATRTFQAGVLDFLMRHEDVLLAFSESEGVKAESLVRAHRALSSADSESF